MLFLPQKWELNTSSLNVSVVWGRIYVALTFLNHIVVLICLGVGFGLVGILKSLVLLGQQLLVCRFSVVALVYINDLELSNKLHFTLIYLCTTYIIHPSIHQKHCSVDPFINQFIHLASDWCIHQFIQSFILHRSMHRSSRRSRKLTLDSKKATSLVTRVGRPAMGSKYSLRPWITVVVGIHVSSLTQFIEYTCKFVSPTVAVLGNVVLFWIRF